MNGYNFTEHVRMALALAREEAVRLQHQYVGTEHILLGFTRVDECCAVLALKNLSIDIAAVRAAVESVAKAGRQAPLGPDLPYTSRAKKVLELAMAEARELGHSFVGTEHLLLGVLREEKGIAGQALLELGLTLEAARAEVLRILGTNAAPADRQGEPKHRGPTGYNFTMNVRSVLGKARREAAALHHEYVGTEHILLALLTESDSIAVGALKVLAVDAHAVRATIIDTIKKGRATIAVPDDLPYTSRAKKVLELAMTEARELGHNYVGTEHLLLGLVREEKGIAAQVLTDRGVKLEAARQAVTRLMRDRGAEPIGEKADAAIPLAESSGEFVVSQVTSETSGSTLLRMTLGGVSIVAGGITLVRLFTSDDVISGYAALLSAIELAGGALLLSHRTMRTGGWILLGIFTIAIVTRLAQLTFPGPVLVQAATTFFLLTRGRMSFRMHQNPRT